MMTIVTHIQLKEGTEPEWDAVMRKRLAAAKKQPGWVGGQLLRPSDKPSRRVIVGTWRTRADWEGWHKDPRFGETRRQRGWKVGRRSTGGTRSRLMSGRRRRLLRPLPSEEASGPQNARASRAGPSPRGPQSRPRTFTGEVPQPSAHAPVSGLPKGHAARSCGGSADVPASAEPP